MAKNVRRRPKYTPPTLSCRIRTKVRNDADTHEVRSGEYIVPKMWSRHEVELYRVVDVYESGLLECAPAFLMPCAERRNGDRFNLCIAKDEDNKPRSKHTMRRCDVVPVLAFPEYESVPKVTGKERGSHINRLTTAMELRQAERVKEPETQPRISNCTKCFDCTLYRREPCKKGLTHVYLTWEMP